MSDPDRRVAQRLMKVHKIGPKERRVAPFSDPSEMLRALPPAGTPRSKGKCARATEKTATAGEPPRAEMVRRVDDRRIT